MPKIEPVIGKLQTLKHQLVSIAVDVEPARGLSWYAAHAADVLPEEASRMLASAKVHICNRFKKTGGDATEAHCG